ncbi:COX5A-domain-containing protein [Auriculariales sp. MPI-PUGE-AT-0066]|nr:COX5A-domain-containing protein [Auriculariales sp. MPI-PUGE-AT-0066]
MSLRPALSLALRSARAGPLAASRRVATSMHVVGARQMSGHGEGHIQETFEQFTDRYVAFFNGVEDLFELQRGLNNCFAHDLVPATGIIEAALKAARRVDDYATAVRIFEGVREKVENRQQYDAYLSELEGIRKELGVETKEELYTGKP